MATSVLEQTLASVSAEIRSELNKSSILTWLGKLDSIYVQEGVLTDSHAPALHSACPSADECWRRLPGAAQPAGAVVAGPADDGSIFWPWVGEHYELGGVAIVALNLNHGPDL